MQITTCSLIVPFREKDRPRVSGNCGTLHANGAMDSKHGIIIRNSGCRSSNVVTKSLDRGTIKFFVFTNRVRHRRFFFLNEINVSRDRIKSLDRIERSFAAVFTFNDHENSSASCTELAYADSQFLRRRLTDEIANVR